MIVIDENFEIIFDEVIFLFGRSTYLILLYIYFKKQFPEIISSFKMPEKKFIYAAFGTGILMYIFGGYIISWNFYYISEILTIPSVLDEIFYHPYYYDPESSLSYYLVLFYSVVIIAPITEELFFRGFIYSIIRKYNGITKALIVSTALFALAHFDIHFRFIPLVLSSIFLAYLYEKSKSLIPPIIVHAVFNFIVFMD